MPTLTLAPHSSAAWFMFNLGTQELHSCSFNDACSSLTQFATKKKRENIHTDTPTMETTIKWYMRRLTRPLKNLGYIQQLHFHGICWNQDSLVLLSRAFTFHTHFNTFGMYHCSYKKNVLKIILYHGMFFWKAPLPNTIVLRDCDLGTAEGYCLKRSFCERSLTTRTCLHVDENDLKGIVVKMLFDVEFRTGLRIIGCYGPVTTAFREMSTYLVSSEK